MAATDKKALMDRLNNVGMVTPTLTEGRVDQMDPVRDIETITGEILEARRTGGEAILTIGRRLIEAKALLSDGEWLPWLAERVEFSPRTAQRFMKLSREWSNATALSHLGASKALALLALPESEREEFLCEPHQVNGEEKTVIDMTSRELERAIKERDEARKAAEQARADARVAAEARASMEESLKEANELLDRSRTDVQLAHDVATGLERQLAELKAAPVEVAIAEVDQEALDKARAEGEAAKAEEIAQLQAQLDKAREAKKRSDDKRKDAEASVDILKHQMEEAARGKAQAAAMSDPEVAKFQVYFDQVQEIINKMRGLLLKVRGRADQATAEKFGRAINALGDAVKEAAQ